MGLKFANNATTTLAAGISNSATSLSVQSGAGGLFPTLTASDYFYCTLANISGNVEIVKVTARSADTFTVVRGYDNTTAMAWNAGDKVELRAVAAGFNDINAGIAAAAPLASPALTGTPTAPTSAQFNNSTNIATTAFAQAVGLHSAGLGNYSSSVTLGAADIGRACYYNSASAGTLTLPDPVALGLSSGALIVVSCVGAGTLTLARSGTATIYAYGVSAATSLILKTGDGVALAFNGSDWMQVGGTARLSGDSTRTYSVAAGVATTDAMSVGQAFGIGQTFQTVTRTSGTTYTNSTAKTIFGSVSWTSTQNTSSVSISINGGAAVIIGQSYAGGTSYTGASASYVIKPGESYVLTYTGTGFTATNSERF
jgi:hypothetical protein